MYVGYQTQSARFVHPSVILFWLLSPRSDQKKTKVKKKTSDPQFEETFYFEVSSSLFMHLARRLYPDVRFDQQSNQHGYLLETELDRTERNVMCLIPRSQGPAATRKSLIFKWRRKTLKSLRLSEFTFFPTTPPYPRTLTEHLISIISR